MCEFLDPAGFTVMTGKCEPLGSCSYRKNFVIFVEARILASRLAGPWIGKGYTG
jgi:hypothetical protein